MKEYIIGAFLAFALMIGIQLSSCNRNTAEGAGIGKRIDSVLVIRHDTLLKIDSVLRTRTRYIDTSKVSVVHDTLNKMIPDTTHDTVIISSNQLRSCVKCEDSLQSCKKIIEVDSSTIDSLTKIGKEKASPNLIDDAKKVGVGVLIGIAIKSLF